MVMGDHIEPDPEAIEEKEKREADELQQQQHAPLDPPPAESVPEPDHSR